MQRIQAEMMWFVWHWIDKCVVEVVAAFSRGQLITKSPIWDWYLTHIAVEAYYREIKLSYIKEGLWPPPVAEGE